MEPLIIIVIFLVLVLFSTSAAGRGITNKPSTAGILKTAKYRVYFSPMGPKIRFNFNQHSGNEVYLNKGVFEGQINNILDGYNSSTYIDLSNYGNRYPHTIKLNLKRFGNSEQLAQAVYIVNTREKPQTILVDFFDKVDQYEEGDELVNRFTLEPLEINIILFFWPKSEYSRRPYLKIDFNIADDADDTDDDQEAAT